MTTLLEILHKKAEPYKVTLMRGQEGTYGWEITVSGVGPVYCHDILEIADKDLRERFGGGDQV